MSSAWTLSADLLARYCCSPPCRVFSPTLSSFAAQHPRHDEFCVIFVSSDHDELAMRAFAQGKHFVSIRFDADARLQIRGKMGVSMYPSLYVVNPQTGETLTTWGRSLLTRDGAMESWLRGESGESKYVKMLAVATVCLCLLVLKLLGSI
eukprot:COSAG02_NODE_1237_length_13725_cov_27.071921_17_plen_150_part_00